MGKFEVHLEAFGGDEGDRLLAAERSIAGPAFAGKPRAIAHEGDQAAVFELFPDRLLVLDALDEATQGFGVECILSQARERDARQVLAQQGLRRAAENSASRCRESDFDARLDPIGREHDGASFEHLLPARVDADRSALSAAGATGRVPCDGIANRTGDEVFDGESGHGVADPERVETRFAGGHAHPKLRGCGEGVALHVIDEEAKPLELERASQVLVRGIAATIEALAFTREVGAAAAHAAGVRPASACSSRLASSLWVAPSLPLSPPQLRSYSSGQPRRA